MASLSEYDLTLTSGSGTDVSTTLFLYYRPILLTALASYWWQREM